MSEQTQISQEQNEHDLQSPLEQVSAQIQLLESRLPGHAEKLASAREALGGIDGNLDEKATAEGASLDKKILEAEQQHISSFNSASRMLKNGVTAKRLAAEIAPAVALHHKVPEMVSQEVEPVTFSDFMAVAAGKPNKRTVENPQFTAIKEKVASLIPDRVEEVISHVPRIFNEQLIQKNAPESVVSLNEKDGEQHAVVEELTQSLQEKVDAITALADARTSVEVGKLAARFQRGKSEQQNAIDRDIYSKVDDLYNFVLRTSRDQPRYVHGTVWYREVLNRRSEVVALRRAILRDVIGKANEQLSPRKGAGLSRYMVRTITAADIPQLATEGQSSQSLDKTKFDPVVTESVDAVAKRLRDQGRSNKQIYRELAIKYHSDNNNDENAPEAIRYINAKYQPKP